MLNGLKLLMEYHETKMWFKTLWKYYLKKTSSYIIGNHKRFYFFNGLLLQLEQQNYHHLNCHLDLSIFMISLTLHV